MPYEEFAVTMAHNFKTLTLKPFGMTWVLNTSFRVCIHPLEWHGGNGEHNLV
jgi:hypothetical protein